MIDGLPGQDLRSRTIFEDFLFLDKSMKPVGSDILIDIESFRGLLNSSNVNLSLYYLIGSLMDQNKFTMILHCHILIFMEEILG